jgi:hypothetical protein
LVLRVNQFTVYGDIKNALTIGMQNDALTQFLQLSRQTVRFGSVVSLRAVANFNFHKRAQSLSDRLMLLASLIQRQPAKACG